MCSSPVAGTRDLRTRHDSIPDWLSWPSFPIIYASSPAFAAYHISLHPTSNFFPSRHRNIIINISAPAPVAHIPREELIITEVAGFVFDANEYVFHAVANNNRDANIMAAIQYLIDGASRKDWNPNYNPAFHNLGQFSSLLLTWGVVLTAHR